MSYEDWNSRKCDLTYRDTEVFIQLEIYNDSETVYTNTTGTTTSWLSRGFKGIRVIKGNTPTEFLGECVIESSFDFGEYSDTGYKEATEKFKSLVKDHLGA